MKFCLPESEMKKLAAIEYDFDQLKKSIDQLKQDVDNLSRDQSINNKITDDVVAGSALR